MRPRSDNDLFLRRHLAGVAAGATPAWLGALLAHKKGFPKARLMGTRRGFIRERHNTFAWGDRRPGFRHHAVRAVAFIVALSSAIALAGGKHPLEYLDEQTGATVSAVGEPPLRGGVRVRSPRAAGGRQENRASAEQGLGSRRRHRCADTSPAVRYR